MKLLGRDIDGEALLERIEAKLRAAGESLAQAEDELDEGVEPPLDPMAFNLRALEEHADPTRPLPLATHRGGAGRVVLLAKWAFRKSCQVFINETLGRQRQFNIHTREAYAQLAAEVLRLRREMETLRARAGQEPPPPPRKLKRPLE